jgi:signal transduction histidine kinase
VLSLSQPAEAISVAAPADDLRLIIGNLLDNASRYSAEHGEIHLSIALRGTEVVLTVADQGIGITALALPRIFDPFVQDSPALGLGGPSPGIGLTVVRALAEALGGRILASSAGRGCGSVFELTLPLAAAAGPDADNTTT